MLQHINDAKRQSLCLICVLFLLGSSHESTFKANLTQTGYQQQNCVSKILNQYFRNCLRIVVMNFEDDFIKTSTKHPIIIRTETKNMIDFESIKVCAYIIKLNDTNLHEVFDHLTTDRMWNSRANFLLLTQHLSPKKIFETLSEYYIYNVAVATEKDVFSYFPFVDENVNLQNTVPVLLDECVNGSLMSNSDLYPNKIPKYWRNSTLDAAVQYILPYTLCLYGCENKGIEFEIVHFLMDSLKFVVNPNPRNYSQWGVKRHGKYDKAFGALQNREAHFVVGVFQSNERNSEDFDMTFSYSEDYIHWIVPKAQPLPHTAKLLSLCDTYAWLVVAASYAAVSCTIFLLGIYVDKSNYFREISVCFITGFLVLLGQSVVGIPGSRVGIRVFILWIFFSFVFTNMLKAHLVFMLSHELHEAQIENEDDIMNSKIRFGMLDKTALSFASDNEFDKYVRKNYETCELNAACSLRVTETMSFATLVLKSIFGVTTGMFLSPKGEMLVYMFKKPLRLYLFNMYFVKGFPIFPQINWILLQMKSGGFVDYFDSHVQMPYDIAFGKKTTAMKSIDSKVLKYENFHIIFKMYGCGMAIALCIFCLEYCKILNAPLRIISHFKK